MKQISEEKKGIQKIAFMFKDTLHHNRFALMEIKMESQNHLSRLHRNRGELTKQLTSEEGRQLVPVTHTRTLCCSQRGGVFSLMSFLQLLLSLIAPPGPYYPTDSKATCSHHQLCDFYLSNQLYSVPIDNKGPTSLSVPFIVFSLSL